MTSSLLHIIAMFFMLLDHIWATQANIPMLFTCIGRLAFPIFAFLISEGIEHTHNTKKYILRMFIFAVISEIPFNLMVSRSIIYPFYQNVLWTFLIAIICISTIKRIKQNCNSVIYYISTALIIIVGYLLGTIGMVDYLGEGVLTVIAFYIFKDKKILQFIALFYIHTQMLGGYYFEWYHMQIPLQGFALFSFLFIWLYNGKKGIKNKPFQYFCYGFYPLHMLLLTLV